MSDPRRILDDAGTDALEKALLGSWENEKPSAAARAKVLAVAGLAVSVTAATAAGTATAATTATAAATAGGSIAPKAAGAGMLAVAKWLAVGAVAVGATSATVVAVRDRTIDARPAPAHTVAAPARPPAPAAAATEEPKTAATAPAWMPVDDRAPAPIAAPRPAARDARQPASTLADQVSTMDRARAALEAGDATRAIALVDDYQVRYPAGAFRQEAEVLRIQSLVRRGDRDAANRSGERFLAAHPQSPHAAHLRALLGRSAGAAP